MKVSPASQIFVASAAAAAAFASTTCSAFSPSSAFVQQRHVAVATTSTQQYQHQSSLRPLSMFGGAGEGVPKDDDEEEVKKMEQAAKAMGMSVDEYKLGMIARTRLSKALDDARVTGGNADTVLVERDGNNPPKYLEIKITDAGKALGKEAVSKELCAALKSSADESRKSRAAAQKDMMAYIGEEMKALGKA